MPDIGVLNLEIHDNSEKAAQGLEALDDVLLRIRHVVQGALGLSKVATEVRRLAKAVDDTLDGSVISKINQLTEALSKLNGLGNINIKINGKTNVDNILDSVRKTQESMTGINTGFDDVARSAKSAQSDIVAFNASVRETGDMMRSPDWSNGVEKFRELYNAWSKFKSSMALGPGEQVGLSTEVEKGWTEWKNGAIEVEGTVSDAMTGISGHIDSTQDKIRMLTDETEKWIEVLDAATGEFKKVHIDDFGRPDESIASAIQVIAAEVEMLGTDSTDTESKIGHLIQKLNILREEVESGKSITGHTLNDKQIVNYKIQIDNLIEKIEHLQSVEANMRDYGTEMVENLVNNYSQIELETMKLEGLKRALAEDIDANKVDTEQIAERTMKIQNLTARIEELKQKEEEEAAALKQIASLRESIGSLQNEFSSKMTGGELDVAGVRDYQTRISELMGQLEELQGKQERLGSSAGMDITNDKARQMAESFMETNSQLDLLKQRADEIKIAMGRGLLNGDLDTKGLAKLYTEYDKVTASIKRAEGEAYGLKDAFAGMKSAVSDLFDPLTKLGKQFVNIAKRMAIRYIIRMFVQGMKEGVENMYVWSKAMGTDFAPAMDKAATAILDLKNSLGAMAAEALQIILPVLDEIIDGVIEVINFFNQMFAAMQGKDTWKEYVRGSAAAKAFDDTTKAAKSTQKAIKDLLADWDELNIIQSESSSGGSGSGLTYDKTKNGEYKDSPISGAAQTVAGIANFFGGIPGILGGILGIKGLIKMDQAFLKYYQDHWPKPEKPSGGATTQQEIKDAADKATNNVVNDAREKITNAVKENTEATQQLVKAEHEVQKLDVAKEIAQMTNDKLDGMAQLRLGNGQNYMGMTLEQFTAQNPLLAGNRVGLRIDAAKEVGSRMLPAKVDTINLMSGVDTISVDVAKAVETSANPSASTPVKATVPALDVVEDVLKGEDIDWDYTFGDGKDHHNPYGTFRKRPDYQPSYQPSYQIPEYPKNWDTTPIDTVAGALESSTKALESTAAATVQAAVQTETATAGATANLAAATEAVNESVPLLEETAQAVESTAQTASVLEEVASAAGGASGAGGDLQFGLIKAEPQLRFVEEDGVIYIFDPEEVKEYGSNNMDYNYMKVGGVGGFSLDPPKDLTWSEKLQGWKFSAETWAAQHAQQAMLALMAAQFVGQYSKGKKEQREAYSNFFGEEYDELSGAKKELVHQGYSPETADAIVETSKEVLKSSLPGFLDWMPDFAEGAISAVEDALVEAGGAAEFVDNLGDAIDHAGGIVLNSVLFPESAQEETVKLLQNPLIESLIDTFQELLIPLVNPNFTTPGDGGFNTNEKSFFRVNPNMVLGATPQEFGYGMGYTPGSEADMATATERGTKAANETLEDNTSETNRLLRQLIANGLHVNLTPNSTMGFFGARAAEAVDRVNG